MAEVYGKGEDRPYTGPRFLSATVEVGGQVRIRFTEAEGGIVATGPVECCVIRGADGVWHSAKVSVDGETILAAASEVPDPCEVRYAWAGSPIGATLRGKATDIPVFPFRWVKPNDQTR
jgi:sialate O-acetylesterase